jgi:hypothetical protein
MAVSWIVAGIGIVLAILGWYMTPTAWGYGMLGFGIACIVLGVLDLFRDPQRAR